MPQTAKLRELYRQYARWQTVCGHLPRPRLTSRTMGACTHGHPAMHHSSFIASGYWRRLAAPAMTDGASPAHTYFASPAHTDFFVYLTHLRIHDSLQLRSHRLHSSLNSPCNLKLSCAHMIRLTCAYTTSLWTFIYVMISFCSLFPQYHGVQPSKPRAQPSKPRVHPSSACTTEVNSARVQARQIRVYSRSSARCDLATGHA